MIKVITMDFLKVNWLKSGLVLAIVPFLWGCEDVIDLETQTGPPLLVVDGWIYNQPGPQEIRLSKTGAYFDNAPATPALNARVWVQDNRGAIYEFKDVSSNGRYVWEVADSTMGAIGRQYTLHIEHEGEKYTAQNEIKRVPRVDSLIFTHESWPTKPEKGPKDGFIAEFYARDLEGAGDTYWIKPLRDGKPYKSNPVNISIAYDAAGSKESATDGLIFILPIRQSLTIGELFNDKDSVGVELLSINESAFRFLEQVRTEASNGGLFAVPFANIPGNIKSESGTKALGFFGASAVSRLEGRVDANTARPRR
ncbi:hypothetical protein GCM10023091_33450 [Ravibacter arvi]|uniref:DUF4249 domain-containing protein n=2 Tax=Ravibacter arvi TaxID=2051041 RepID=A0ABP8M6X3_9BACT